MRSLVLVLILVGLVVAAMLAAMDRIEKDREGREVSPYVPKSLQPVARMGRTVRRLILAGIGAWIFALARWGWVTVLVTGLILALAGYLMFRFRETIRIRRKVIRPLALALAPILGTEPRAWRHWLRVPLNLDDPDAVVTLLFPPKWQGIDGERDAVRALIQRRLPGTWEARFEFAAFRAVFTHPPPPPDNVVYDESVSHVQHVIPIGQGSRGTWRKMNLRSKSPHFVIAAPTRWGKTVTLTLIVAHFAQYGGIVDICDPKRIGFLKAFRGLSNVHIHTDIESMENAIHTFRTDMDARYAAEENGDDISDETRYPSRMLILDEMGSLLEMVMERFYRIPAKEREGRKPRTVSDIMYILWQGGYARFHIGIGAQQANANVLVSSDGRDQLGVKIASGPQSLGSWRMLFGNEPKQGTGRRKGDAIVGEGDALERVQLAYIEPETALAMARAGESPQSEDESPPPADMPSSVLGQSVEPFSVVGNAAGADFVGMTVAAFVKARQRSPIEGQGRVGNQPAWTEGQLRSWQSRRPRAGGRTEDAA